MPIVKSSAQPLWQSRINLANIRLPWLIVTLVVFAGLIKLGMWQSARAVEKEQRLARITQFSGQQALPLLDMLAMQNYQPEQELTEKFVEQFNDFPVSLAGNFDPNVLFLLDNQVNNGELGYRVLQLVTVEQYAVIVNLGWVKGSIDRQKLPDVVPITGQHQLSGHVRYIESGIMLMAQDFTKQVWPMRIQQIELDKMALLVEKSLLPFVIYLDDNTNVGYLKEWQPIVMPPEKHRGYAFQWFSLATAWLLLMLWASGVVNFRGNKLEKLMNNSTEKIQ
ncbi:SURF1 family protein [Thalassotalea sp. PLHSN55]|uniref:SURF1 family protein n=1 Tax=Thalassotalea sp. PLHSN55 TaxID=3435888 RepID=UPI003F83A10C